MTPSRSPRDFWATLLPTAGGVLAFAVAFRAAESLSSRPIPWWLMFVLVFAGAAGAWHRPFPPGATTPGLGAAILPLALSRTSAASSALLLAASFVIAELALRLMRRTTTFLPPERRSLVRTLESAGRTSLAALAAGGAWAWIRGLRPGWGLATALVVAAFSYLIVWTALEAADRKTRRPDQPWRLIAAALLPLTLDTAGWILGGAFALASLQAGWALTGFLVFCVGLLFLEAARNGFLFAKARQRAQDLGRLQRAGERMISSAQEMASVADRIRIECAKVVPLHWYQFEALAPGSELRTWFAVADGELQEGVPEPDRYAPVLPGFHRRTTWQILERQLRADGQVLARLRFWCDPRRLEPEKVVLLDRLLPQMTASVQRCLLDREAREDPLTGVAMRRVLEKRLHEVHARCCEEGGAMAVILCDLDFFKRINDTFGHPAGDAALVAVAGILKEFRRASDLCCRYGGEEFVLLVDEVGGDAALAIAERLRRRVEDYDFQVDGQRVPLTLSAGVAAFPDLYIKTAAELILFADEALYEAKRRGRNRCLLDLGQGRYLDVDGNVYATEEGAPAVEAPRIFA